MESVQKYEETLQVRLKKCLRWAIPVIVGVFAYKLATIKKGKFHIRGFSFELDWT